MRSIAMRHLLREVAEIRAMQPSDDAVELDGPDDPRRQSADHAHLDGECIKNRYRVRCRETLVSDDLEESIRRAIVPEMRALYPDGIPVEESAVEAIVSAEIGVSIDDEEDS